MDFLKEDLAGSRTRCDHAVRRYRETEWKSEAQGTALSWATSYRVIGVHFFGRLPPPFMTPWDDLEEEAPDMFGAVDDVLFDMWVDRHRMKSNNLNIAFSLHEL